MIRSIAKSVYLSAAGKFVKPSQGTHFLNGHYVSPYAENVDVQQEIFFKQLRALSKYAQLVSAEEALSEVHQRKASKICLTFDDGYEDVYSVIVPVLQTLNIKAIFFVNPTFLGLNDQSLERALTVNYETKIKKHILSTQQVNEIAKQGHEIGSHTLSHKRLNISDTQTLIREIEGSKIEVSKITGKPCRCFAYPFGGRDDLSQDALLLSLQTYDFVFSSIRSDGLFSFNGQVINRRHFEGNWPASHVNYFLAGRK